MAFWHSSRISDSRVVVSSCCMMPISLYGGRISSDLNIRYKACQRRKFSRSGSVGTERRQARPQPLDQLGKQAQASRQVVLALRVVVHRHGQAALPRPIQVTLDLGIDVELVLTAVGDVH